MNDFDYNETITANTETFAIDTIDATQLEAIIVVSNVTGTNPVLKIIPQFTIDRVNWYDTELGIAPCDKDCNKSIRESVQLGTSYRFKIEVSGTSPSFDLNIAGITK